MRAALIVLLIHISCSYVVQPQELPASLRYHVTNGAQGKEFFIAIPPNEILPFPADELEVYISSAYDTEVEIFDYSGNRSYKRNVNAGQIRTLSDVRGETNWTWEIREFERVVKKAIRLRSAFPITVSVLNSKVTTSDGYLALPVSNWDTEYIVTTYYDFREFKPWAGGFVVIAKENGTVINVLLRGVGELVGKTEGGKSINADSSYQVVMDEGDVYYVKGNGQTRGEFDLTGTEITSNVPVGLISTHERSTMPNQLVNGNGRNHLVEMNIPVSQWDTSYVSLQFDRDFITENYGDVIRVVAAEANTKWKMKSYDQVTKQVIQEESGIITKPGGFAETSQSKAPIVLVRGITEWSADKPIQVVQFSCSSSMDGDPIYDPFQINLLPKERFVYGSVFQTPTNTKFPGNFLNLIVLADPNDTGTINNLKAITLDNKPVWLSTNASPGSILTSNVTGTDIWFVRIQIEQSSHIILSPHLAFGGYVLGYGEFDAYGWPLGPLHANNIGCDTAAPVVNTNENGSTKWQLVVTEKTNIPAIIRANPLKTDQIDAGIANAGLVPNSTNLVFTTINAPGERREDATEALYDVNVVDATKPASGRVFILDYAANVRYVDVVFVPPPLIASKKSISFGTIRVGSQKRDSVKISNHTNEPVVVTAVQSSDPSFTITGVTYPFTMNPTTVQTIRIIASPTVTDSVMGEITFVTNSKSTTIDVDAFGVKPQFGYTSNSFGRVAPDSTVCSTNRITLRNTGQDTLIITHIELASGTAFTFDSPKCPPLPIKLVAGAISSISCVCFTSSIEGLQNGTLLVQANDRQEVHEIPLTVTVDPTLDVYENTATNEFTIRQVGGTVECTWNESLQPTHWTLTTINGELSLSGDIAQNATSISIDASTLSAGVYALQIQTRSGVVRKSVVIGQ